MHNAQCTINRIRRTFSIFNFKSSTFPLLAFAGALVVYWLTVDHGASYWDCPEYLITALRLETGHPPGNPGWALTHRFVTSLFSGPSTQVLAVNMMSGFFTALSAMLLCIVCMTIMRRIFSSIQDAPPFSVKHSSFPIPNSSFLIGLASLAASLCFAWSDSAWYSAVEAEVYAMSLFLSSLTVWMAFKWAFSFSKAARARWMVALAYVIGFSLGVHQLNLLALPAIALIMLSGVRRWRDHLILRRASVFIAACAAVGIILKGIMPGSLALAKAADIFAVNTLGLPFWSGAIIAWSLLILILLSLSIYFTHCKKFKVKNLSLITWIVAAILLGYSVYIIIPIRAWANSPVNEGDPSTIGRFADYLDRRQYGEAPLLYGRTPNSKIMRVERASVAETGDTTYDYSWNAMKVRGKDMRRMIKGGHIPQRSRFLSEDDKALNAKISADSSANGYVVAGFHTEPIYTPELDMWLPRIHSTNAADLPAYRDWTGMDTSNMVKVKVSQAIDSFGRCVAMRNFSGDKIEKYELRPTYLQSLSYLAGYQTGYMYLRYLMWNFCGRQNDVPATGEIDHGNFITGFPQVDDLMLGDQSALPDDIGNGNEGHNVYWCIPFILGTIGIVWLFAGKGKSLAIGQMRNAAWYTLALFLMTGVAIVVYLNQTPGEPRERDYTFLGSYWAFSIWIAMGMLWLMRLARRKWQRWLAVAFVCSVPVWMLAENYRDHDRSGRSATLDYAANLLESLDEDAILFVDGDNYIFPLWFAQEVMGVRRDVSVVCNSFLVSDWYLPQLMTPRHGYDGLQMTATEGDVALGNFNLIRLPGNNTDTVPAVEALKELYADDAPTPKFHHRWLEMGSDRNGRWVFDLLSIPGKSANSIAGLREVAVVDIIATNAASRYPRPVYWHQGLSANKFNGFFPYTRQALYTRKLMPAAPDSLILTEESLNALPKLKWGGIDRMAYPGPDVASQAELQRASLVHLAEALADEGRDDQALHVARTAMVRYPSRLIPYGIRRHCDSTYFEASRLASVLIKAGTLLGDTAAVNEGNRIRKADSIRAESYRRYRLAIPSSRRQAISPATNNRTLHR